jgi:uncharacterized protein YndB with AHSA1/START domain
MPTPFRFDRGWRFGVPPDALWATLTSTDEYRQWWPWLVALDLEGPAFTVGSRAHFTIQAPLPYRLRCTTTVVDVEPGVLLVAHVDGDLAGHASLAIAPGGGGSGNGNGVGSAAHLCWELDARATPLRALARVARPAMTWGHDQIVERGLAEFEQRALSAPARDASAPSPGAPSSAARRGPPARRAR